MSSPPPLRGIRVLEIAGLAPGPFAGLLCADWGADVLRLDRPRPNGGVDEPAKDLLTRRKRSIKVDLKDAGGKALVKDLLKSVDVLIEPFRPGVLERLQLSPEDVLLKVNPRLIVARMTGFRRSGKYKDMAGHDINYVAVSGVLSMLGGSGGSKPIPAMNLLGDFAGGGLVCFLGIVMALYERTRSGIGQVVEANMVDGAAFIATSPRLAMKTPLWAGERGTNLLDGGCPYYDTYRTSDGQYVAVGALEPEFFLALLKGLSISEGDLPGPRADRAVWPWLRTRFTQVFASKTRNEWEGIFDGTDACVTPVLSQRELEENRYQQRPIVTLGRSPSYAIASASTDHETDIRNGQGSHVAGEGWSAVGLEPGEEGKEALSEWMGWRQGEQYRVQNDGLVKTTASTSTPKL